MHFPNHKKILCALGGPREKTGDHERKTVSASACSTTEKVALGHRPSNCHSPDRSRGRPECPLVVGVLRGTRYRLVVERLCNIGGCGLWTTEGSNPDWCAPKSLASACAPVQQICVGKASEEVRQRSPTRGRGGMDRLSSTLSKFNPPDFRVRPECSASL